MKVLLVDDNRDIIETIIDYADISGVVIDFAYHGQAAIELLKDNVYDVVVMDIMMPKMDGLKTVIYIRKDLHLQTPIIFLTACNELSDKLEAFSIGADDYLNKPFALEELFVRISALSKRVSTNGINVMQYKMLKMDSDKNEVRINSEIIMLNPIQYKILWLLLKNEACFINKQKISDAIWRDELPDSDALRSHLYQLRKKIGKYTTELIIENKHGLGYRLV